MEYQKATLENKTDSISSEVISINVFLSFKCDEKNTFQLWSVVKLPCNTNSKNLRYRF